MVEIAIAGVQYSSWPIAVLVCVFLLRKELAILIRRLRILRAGSVEVQLTEQLHMQGFTKAQLSVLSDLSADDIDIFMLVSFTHDAGFKYSTGFDPLAFKSSMLRLQDAGLLRVTNPDDPGTNLLHELTLTGRRFRTLLVSTSTSLVRGAA